MCEAHPCTDESRRSRNTSVAPSLPRLFHASLRPSCPWNLVQSRVRCSPPAVNPLVISPVYLRLCCGSNKGRYAILCPIRPTARHFARLLHLCRRGDTVSKGG